LIIIPAIDLKGGKAVRLQQGLADQVTVYGDDPVAVAKSFVDAGAKRIHVVDLDGAFAGRSVHRDLIARIASLGVPVQTGGGVRNVETLVSLLELGCRWVILGTSAIKDRPFVEEALRRFCDHVVIGIDARDGLVRGEGWIEASTLTPVELAREVRDLGAQRVIYTNISTDGMLSGPDLDGLRRLAQLGGLALTASGGVASIEHLEQLKSLEGYGVDSCIVGKALYEGKLDLAKALEAIR
jgi:phosphoribosylformimino-5-aminoimidazole carboxamide ribotide isomerase